MWPFSPKPLLEPHLADWVFDQADWLLRHHVHAAVFARAQLLPLSAKAFQLPSAGGHERARALFAQVKTFCGVAHTEMTLVERGDSGRFRSARGLAPQPKSGPAGTYRKRNGAIEISYDSSMAPADLVAVFAHEIAHAVLGFGAATPPPGDAEFEELRTDFTAIFMGFGLYLLQFRAGPGPATPEMAHEFRKVYMYYMNAREISFTTALFCEIREVERSLLIRHAPTTTAWAIKRAYADLDRRAQEVSELRVFAKRRAILAES